jgi:heat-inducible transcriptional repressor
MVMAQPVPHPGGTTLIEELDARSRDVFRAIVEGFMETGEPIGSRTLSRRMGIPLSPATIRNVMADLEDLGLLYAPHTSAGRLPTEHGLRLFVDGLLECGNLTEDEHNRIESLCVAAGRSLPEVLEQATSMLSGLSRCAGLVTAPKTDTALRHIEFVSLGPGRALVVLVTDTGLVENRIIDLPLGMPASSLVEATNYLSARLVGRSLSQAQEGVRHELERDRATLDELTRKVVETGLASWSDADGEGVLIVRGQANLLDDINAIGELERVRALFSVLETKEALLRLLQATDAAAGVQIFIGAESELFSLAGCSMVVAPYKNSQQRIVGAVGVIGPMRINYSRIVPMVDFTAKAIGRLVG